MPTRIRVANYSRLRLWVEKAEKALGTKWERCDEETGAECLGEKCSVGAHRALVYLNRALDELNQASDINDVLLTAVKIALQKHEPYAGYKTTMLRQALGKAKARGGAAAMQIGGQ